jgi:hypothetical protein
MTLKQVQGDPLKQVAYDMLCIVIPTFVSVSSRSRWKREGSENVHIVLPDLRTHFAYTVFIRSFDYPEIHQGRALPMTLLCLGQGNKYYLSMSYQLVHFRKKSWNSG